MILYANKVSVGGDKALTACISTVSVLMNAYSGLDIDPDDLMCRTLSYGNLEDDGVCIRGGVDDPPVEGGRALVGSWCLVNGRLLENANATIKTTYSIVAFDIEGAIDLAWRVEYISHDPLKKCRFNIRDAIPNVRDVLMENTRFFGNTEVLDSTYTHLSGVFNITDSPDERAEVVEFLSGCGVKRPIVVITPKVGESGSEFLVDPDNLHSELFGLADVVTCTDEFGVECPDKRLAVSSTNKGHIYIFKYETDDDSRSIAVFDEAKLARFVDRCITTEKGVAERVITDVVINASRDYLSMVVLDHDLVITQSYARYQEETDEQLDKLTKERQAAERDSKKLVKQHRAMEKKLQNKQTDFESTVKRKDRDIARYAEGVKKVSALSGQVKKLEADLEEARASTNNWEHQAETAKAMLADQKTTMSTLKASKDAISQKLKQAESVIRALESSVPATLDSDAASNEGNVAYRLLLEQREPSPEECLRLIEAEHSNVVLLPSAIDSAQKSRHFKGSRVLLELLDKLPSFLRAYQEHGDEVARRTYTNNQYSANESDAVMSSPKHRKLREFVYNGTPVLMDRHLKIGRAANTEKTIRVHFHMDLDNDLVVIGYCGGHLPLPG